LDPQDSGFLDPDPQKYADPPNRIQGAKISTKNCKNTDLLSNPKSELLKKKSLSRCGTLVLIILDFADIFLESYIFIYIYI